MQALALGLLGKVTLATSIHLPKIIRGNCTHEGMFAVNRKPSKLWLKPEGRLLNKRQVAQSWPSGSTGSSGTQGLSIRLPHHVQWRSLACGCLVAGWLTQVPGLT